MSMSYWVFDAIWETDIDKFVFDLEKHSKGRNFSALSSVGRLSLESMTETLHVKL